MNVTVEWRKSLGYNFYGLIKILLWDSAIVKRRVKSRGNIKGICDLLSLRFARMPREFTTLTMQWEKRKKERTIRGWGGVWFVLECVDGFPNAGEGKNDIFCAGRRIVQYFVGKLSENVESVLNDHSAVIYTLKITHSKGSYIFLKYLVAVTEWNSTVRLSQFCACIRLWIIKADKFKN